MAVAAATLFSAGASASKVAKTAASKPYTFVLSNNFLGNDWRPQVERLATLTSNVAPFKGNVSMKIVNSANTNQAQISDLNNIIETKPDVILLIPGSTTALNRRSRVPVTMGSRVHAFGAGGAAVCVQPERELL